GGAPRWILAKTRRPSWSVTRKAWLMSPPPSGVHAATDPFSARPISARVASFTADARVAGARAGPHTPPRTGRAPLRSRHHPRGKGRAPEHPPATPDQTT